MTQLLQEERTRVDTKKWTKSSEGPSQKGVKRTLYDKLPIGEQMKPTDLKQTMIEESPAKRQVATLEPKNSALKRAVFVTGKRLSPMRSLVRDREAPTLVTPVT
jgi:hypothetical protein